MPRIIIACLLLGLFGLSSRADEFVAGRHYQPIAPPVETSTAGKVEIVELFWYGCPHCYAFEPLVEKWIATKPDYVEFVRVPAVFARSWEIHARAYYAAEQLGVLDETHGALFDALHQEKRKLFSVDELTAFFGEHGVSAEAFRAAYDSFDVDRKTRRAIALTRSYGISGVPAVVINGRFRSSAQQTGTYEDLLKVVDYLAAKENAR